MPSPIPAIKAAPNNVASEVRGTSIVQPETFAFVIIQLDKFVPPPEAVMELISFSITTFACIRITSASYAVPSRIALTKSA